MLVTELKVAILEKLEVKLVPGMIEVLLKTPKVDSMNIDNSVG